MLKFIAYDLLFGKNFPLATLELLLEKSWSKKMKVDNLSQQPFGSYLLKIPTNAGERRLKIFEEKFGQKAMRIFNEGSRNYCFEDEAVIGKVKKYIDRNQLPSRSYESDWCITPWAVKTFAKEPFDIKKNPAKEHPFLFKLCPALFNN